MTDEKTFECTCGDEGERAEIPFLTIKVRPVKRGAFQGHHAAYIVPDDRDQHFAFWNGRGESIRMDAEVAIAFPTQLTDDYGPLEYASDALASFISTLENSRRLEHRQFAALVRSRCTFGADQRPVTVGTGSGLGGWDRETRTAWHQVFENGRTTTFRGRLDGTDFTAETKPSKPDLRAV